MSFLTETNYNAADYAEEEFSAIQPGKYMVAAVKIEEKETKNKNGMYIKAEFELENGRKVWANFNVQNQSADAQRIGRRQFSNLCTSIGRPTPKDYDELIGVAVMAEIAIDKDDNSRNVIKKFLPATESAATNKAETKAATPEPAAKKPAPWKNR